MIRLVLTCMLILSFVQLSRAQTEEFTTSGYVLSFDLEGVDDTLQAIYQWVANAIEYDTETDYQNKTYSSDDEVVVEVLETRKGICEHYALLFNAVCKSLDIESYKISGYTKQDGKINTQFGHSWNAVKKGPHWYLFDPTWGSGYVKDGLYTKEYDHRWFMVKPEEFIKTHVPYDPIWQLLSYPLSNMDIIQSRQKPAKPVYYNINDSIDIHLNRNEQAQVLTSIPRIRNQGLTNHLIVEHLNRLNEQLVYTNRNNEIDKMNMGIQIMNEAIVDYNEYIEAKNYQFRRPPLSDATLEAIKESLLTKTKATEKIFINVEPDYKDFIKYYKQNLKVFENLRDSIMREVAFIDTYLNTPSDKRIYLFVE